VSTRSAALAVGQVVGALQAIIYACPPDRYVIVKSFYLSRQAGTAGRLVLSAVRSGASSVTLFETSDVQRGVPMTPEVWVVLQPADQLVLYVAEGTIDYWVSGAELPLPSR
jgi:hypothetical protein